MLFALISKSYALFSRVLVTYLALYNYRMLSKELVFDLLEFDILSLF